MSELFIYNALEVCALKKQLVRTAVNGGKLTYNSS